MTETTKDQISVQDGLSRIKLLKETFERVEPISPRSQIRQQRFVIQNQLDKALSEIHYLRMENEKVLKERDEFKRKLQLVCEQTGSQPPDDDCSITSSSDIEKNIVIKKISKAELKIEDFILSNSTTDLSPQNSILSSRFRSFDRDNDDNKDGDDDDDDDDKEGDIKEQLDINYQTSDDNKSVIFHKNEENIHHHNNDNNNNNEENRSPNRQISSNVIEEKIRNEKKENEEVNFDNAQNDKIELNNEKEENEERSSKNYTTASGEASTTTDDAADDEKKEQRSKSKKEKKKRKSTEVKRMSDFEFQQIIQFQNAQIVSQEDNIKRLYRESCELIEEYKTIVDAQSAEIINLKNQLEQIITLAEKFEQRLNLEISSHNETKLMLESQHLQPMLSGRHKRSSSYDLGKYDHELSPRQRNKTLGSSGSAHLSDHTYPAIINLSEMKVNKKKRKYKMKKPKSSSDLRSETPPLKFNMEPEPKQMSIEQLKRELEVVIALGEKLQSELRIEKESHANTQKQLYEQKRIVDELLEVNRQLNSKIRTLNAKYISTSNGNIKS